MRILLILSFAGIILSGCSTDFDVIAPYKEVMVIDGLINEWDSVQNVRISKAFLGEGNAYVMAQQKDSINYADVLHVTLTELSTGQAFDLARNEQNNKDTGTFASPFVVLYSTNHPINANSKYKLEVTNTSSGTIASSETKIVGNISISPPIQDPVDLASQLNAPVYVTYTPGNNSYVHELRLRFHYREIDPNGISTLHYTDWNLGTVTSTSGEIKYKYYKNSFYEFLQQNIPEKAGVRRRIDTLGTDVNGFLIKPIEYVFIEGSEELNTYIELNKPATGVVTDKPLFTTVTNGIGLFSSRLIRSEFRNLNSATITYMDNTILYPIFNSFDF
jgi:hypothetical protein